MMLKKQLELPDEPPRPMEFLSAVSRKHFREVIEFLEAANIPYVFNDKLLGHRDCYTQTLFEICNDSCDSSIQTTGGDVLTIRGGRYDELLRRYFKVPSHGVGITLSLRPAVSIESTKQIVLPKNRIRPQIFFIQLGYAAQLRSFAIIETLRKARVTIAQSLEVERLSEQLARAERLSIPYTVIMGQKEALEGNVIVRDTNTRAQQTVSVDMLPMFFKNTR